MSISYRANPPETAPIEVETLVDRLSEEDVRAAATANGFRNGEDYFRRGCVVTLTVFDGGSRIESRVQGSERRPYNQSIRLVEERDGSPSIAGVCTCPVGANCKHVVAATLAALHRRDAAPDAPLAPPIFTRGRLQRIAAPASEPLAPDLAGWVDALARLERNEVEDYPPEVRQRLVYVLALDPRVHGLPYLVVTPCSTRLLKDGTFADGATPYRAVIHNERQSPAYIRASDRVILAELLRQPHAPFRRDATTLSGENGAAVLAAMIATGRARWQAVNGAAVSLGPPRPGRIVWRLGKSGAYYPDLEIDDAASLRAALALPPYYVDAQAGVIGPIETGLAPRIAVHVLAAPAVPLEHAQRVRTAIESRIPTLAAIEPPLPAPPERIAVPPAPKLLLTTLSLVSQGYYGYGGARAASDQAIPVARVSFRYGPAELAAHDRRHAPLVVEGGRIYEIKRSLKAERAALARLATLGLRRARDLYARSVPEEQRDDFVLVKEADGSGWLDLVHRQLPSLRADGWEIEIAADFPYRVICADGPVAAELREGSGIDWFELHLGVTVDGERLDLVPALLALLARPAWAETTASADDRPIYVTLPDGRILALPLARLAPILAALHELFAAGIVDPQSPRISLSALEAPAIADLEAAAAASGAAWRGGERIAALGRMLRETGGIPRAVVPASFTGELRGYQARGVDWLQFLRAAGLGGVVADEMGLGKTVQTLAHLAIEKAEGRLDRPALIIVPTSLIANWRRETERFAPGLTLLTLHGAARKERFGDIAGHDIVLTTYPLLARDHATLAAQPWHAVILDEAQTVKNPAAITARLVRTLEARHRLCLTGTPLQNHLGELWSLFAFLAPGYLGDHRNFNRRWRAPIEKHGDAGLSRLLARRVRPFLLRRTKAEVAAELPPKTEMIEAVEMDAPQRDLYESIRLAMHAKVREAIAARGLARSRIIVLDALLKMRQVCCDPRLLRLAGGPARKAGSAKLDRLKEMLGQLLEAKRRVLLFSQFTSMLALIEQELSVPYVLLTGATRDRETPVRRFQEGEVGLFLISLKAGGLGLNLTAADTVIHYDPWWNPAVEDQATDRAHRIGQAKPVFVHKLVMLGSIEEKMDALKARKRDLAAGLFDPDAGSTLELTEADVETLFGGA